MSKLKFAPIIRETGFKKLQAALGLFQGLFSANLISPAVPPQGREKVALWDGSSWKDRKSVWQGLEMGISEEWEICDVLNC